MKMKFSSEIRNMKVREGEDVNIHNENTLKVDGLRFRDDNPGTGIHCGTSTVKRVVSH